MSVWIFLLEPADWRTDAQSNANIRHAPARGQARRSVASQALQHEPWHTPAGRALHSHLPGGSCAPRARGFSTQQHGVLAGWVLPSVTSFSVTHNKLRDEVPARPEPAVQAEEGAVYPVLGSSSSQLAFVPKSAFRNIRVNVTTSLSMYWLHRHRNLSFLYNNELCGSWP